jgi:hypothetical protein
MPRGLEERTGNPAAGRAKMRRRAFALALAGLVGVGEARAQFGGMGRRGGGTRSGGRASGSEQRDSPDALEVSLEELGGDLKLTAEQQPRWDVYRQRVEALAADIGRERKRVAEEDKLDAVQQLKRVVDTQRNRLAAMEDIADAGAAFYSSLTAQQKALADRRLAKVMRGLTAP